MKREKKKDEGLVMIEFKDTDTSLFTYDIQVLNDQVFGGKSEGHITIDQVCFQHFRRLSIYRLF